MVENVHWIAPACAFLSVFLFFCAVLWPKTAPVAEVRFNDDEGEAIPAALVAALERRGRHMR